MIDMNINNTGCMCDTCIHSGVCKYESKLKDTTIKLTRIANGDLGLKSDDECFSVYIRCKRYMETQIPKSGSIIHDSILGDIMLCKTDNSILR